MPMFYKVAKDRPRVVIDSGEIMIEWCDVVPDLGAFMISILSPEGK